MIDRRQKFHAFFSADISGGTQFKQLFPVNKDHNQDKKEWPDVFLQFFSTFPKMFFDKISLLETTHGFTASRPTLWKFNGDEVIFKNFIYKEANYIDFHCITKAFFESIRETDRLLKQHNLGVKGTIWTAGFPIRNKEITLDISGSAPLLITPDDQLNSTSSDHHNSLDAPDIIHADSETISDASMHISANARTCKNIEYIGPEIDIGFRLTAESRSSRVAVSIDAADFLSQYTGSDSFDFYLVGWKILRGVLGGNPYPIFWISDDILTKNSPWDGFDCEYTHALLNRSGRLEPRELRKLISALRYKLRDFIITPYVDASDMPIDHKDHWDSEDV